MAKNTAAVLDESIEPTEEEITPKQVINEGIVRVVEATGIDSSKARYKAMRAIAFQAFVNAIENGEFDSLVEEALANVDALPAGWELERGAKEETPAKTTAKRPSKKTPAKKTAAKKTEGEAPAKKTSTSRRRPSRKA